MIKSPLRYPGGKSRAISLLSPLIPHFTEYREPFVGGGSVFLHCKQMFPDKKYWINDLNPTLFSFWKISQQDINAVIENIYRWRNQYKEGKQLYRFLISSLSSFNNLEMAAAFFIINRITFSGTTESGGFSQQAFEGRFTESSIQRLLPFGKLIQHARITDLDFEDVVTENGDDVFIFLDPPYHSATKSALYGKNGNLHKGFDHIRFANAMKSCPHRWLITYDDSPYIRELFSFANIKAWDLMYGMRNVTASSNQRGKELFISNYEIE